MVKFAVKMCGKICGKIDFFWIGTQIGVVVDIDTPIMIVVCVSSLW